MSSSPSPSSSKFSKLLSKPNRDRSRSLAEAPTASSSGLPASSPSSPPSSSLSTPLPGSRHRHSGATAELPSSGRRGSILGRNSRLRRNAHTTHAGDGAMTDVGEASGGYVRARTRSERPLSNPPAIAAGASTGHLGDRLSGWFNHAFNNTSSNDLTLPHILQRSTSPDRRVHGLLTAARTGKGHLDRAMRYILDSDAAPDKSTTNIWLLGVEHPGFTPSSPSSPSSPARRSSLSVNSGKSSEDELASLSRSTPPAARKKARAWDTDELDDTASRGWPADFYVDFASRVWLTYRSQFPPIRDTTLYALDGTDSASFLSTSPSRSRWAWAGFGERGWTSDSGWGCMLRTGQSLLANALVHLHLGRDWRRPPGPQATAAYARYVEILTWFLDAPSPLAPFSVHRMALAGKELGKDVGQWFGPSTAAGALKTLTDAFPDAHLGVSVAVDSQVFQTDVFAASWDPRAAVGSHRKRTRWGGRAVLVLIGLRLGLDGVNPIYYESVKTLFTWPQSVGIAGGRPSSSYYFVGTQADALFYLDPHHSRPAVQLRPPPPPSSSSPEPQPIPIKARPTVGPPQTPVRQSGSRDEDEIRDRDRSRHTRSPTSPPLGRAHAASPLAKELSTSSSNSSSSTRAGHTRWRTSAPGSPTGKSTNAGVGAFSNLTAQSLIGSSASLLALDPLQQHYVGAYTPQEIRTFSCEKVRKLPLAGLDPSMLLGFLVRDEAEWRDLRARVVELGKTRRAIFSVQDEPPSWPSDADSDMGLESLSEPDSPDGLSLSLGDDVKVVRDGESDDEADGDFFDASEGRPRSFVHVPARADSSASSTGDTTGTEDDPADPLTPGPHHGRGSFDLRALQIKAVPSDYSEISNETFESTRDGPLDDDEGELIGEDEWEDVEGAAGAGPLTPREITANTTRPEPRERVETVRPERVAKAERVANAERVERVRRERTERSPSAVKVTSRQASESSTFTTSSVASSASASSRKEREKGGSGDREKEKEGGGSREKGKGKGKGKGKKSSVPVPFPSASEDVEEERRRVPQMSDRRGRDGGRTQSGGVRGILNEDL